MKLRHQIVGGRHRQSIRLSKSFDRSRENDNSFDDRECSPGRLNRSWKEEEGVLTVPRVRRIDLTDGEGPSPLPLTDQWALSDCRYVLWPRPISWEGYNPPLVGVIRLGSILLSPIPRPGCLHLRLPCPLTRCRTLIECEATSREQGKEFSLLLREFKGCVSNGESIFRGMIKGGDF